MIVPAPMFALALTLTACATETSVVVDQAAGGRTEITIGCAALAPRAMLALRAAEGAASVPIAVVPEGPRRRVVVSNVGGEVIVAVCAGEAAP